MKAYIVCKPGLEELESRIRSWLPEDVDVEVSHNSVGTVESIRSYKKPCIVFIQATKVPINGVNFLEMVAGQASYTHVFVLCEGSQAHNTILKVLELDEDEFICDNTTCTNSSHEIVERRNIGIINTVINSVRLVTAVELSVDAVKAKVDVLERRTKQCVRKLQMISS